MRLQTDHEKKKVKGKKKPDGFDEI